MHIYDMLTEVERSVVIYEQGKGECKDISLHNGGWCIAVLSSILGCNDLVGIRYKECSKYSNQHLAENSWQV